MPSVSFLCHTGENDLARSLLCHISVFKFMLAHINQGLDC